MLVDSHCHLDRVHAAPFGGQLSDVLAAAAVEGVTRILNVSIELEHWPALAEMSAPFPQIDLSIGVHPSALNARAPTVDTLVDLARQCPKVIAVGETGLDYSHGRTQMVEQQARFRTHIAAARVLQKPLIIHTREAKVDTLRILREEGADQVGGIFHCFTEDVATAEEAMALNFMISFSGIITFPNAKALREVATALPLDRLLVETDAPYLAPVPHRGKPNHPALVRHTAAKIAEIRDISLETVAAATTANYHRLFRWAVA